MGTAWETIETQAMTYIQNDISLVWDMRNRLPVFYNRMLSYMREAIPLFNRPAEMVVRLAQNTPPEFADGVYTAEETTTGTTEIDTGLKGYDIVSAGVISQDAYGDPQYNPLPVTYDSATGIVTIGQGIAAGTEITMDFYKSGSFRDELNATEISILAFAVYFVWEQRFDNDAIERKSKIRDGSFTTISEASQTNANSGRQRLVAEQLYGKMREYETNVAYLNTVKNYNL